MKRTALARGAVQLSRKAPLARTAARRARPATQDATATAEGRQERPEGNTWPQDTRDRVSSRSKGLCEICAQPATDLHHRQARRTRQHTVANALHLCREDHARVHAHPKDARDAGWIVSAYSRPDTTPVLVRGRWVLLTEDGYQTDQRGMP